MRHTIYPDNNDEFGINRYADNTLKL